MDSYVVETYLPAAKREDFLVQAFGNQMTIDVRIRPTEEFDPYGIVNRESVCLHYNRKIVLPEDADTGFVSAEYSSGILRFYIPKVTHPIQPRQSIIIIY